LDKTLFKKTISEKKLNSKEEQNGILVQKTKILEKTKKKYTESYEKSQHCKTKN
jgi:hypothetical protein